MEQLVYLYWATRLIKWALIIGAVVLTTMLLTGFVHFHISVGF